MTIALILQGIALCVLGIVVGSQVKDISNLKELVHEMTYNRNLIKKLAKEMDKKIKPVYSNHCTGHSSDARFYVLVDLTEKEKRANELRREIEKLEESDD